MSWADIVILALVALFAVIGVLKGVQKSALSLGAFIVAFLIALFLSNVVAEALLNVEAVRRFVMDGDGFSLYTWIKSGLNSDGASEFIVKNYFNPIASVIAAYKGDMTGFDPVALYTSFVVFAAIVGVGLFIVARLILCIVTMIIKSYIPRKKSAGNRAFGALVGVVRGAVWAFALCVVFSSLGGLTFTSGLDKAESEFEKSVVGKPFLQFSYDFRNAAILPDTDMFSRIVTASGFAVKPGDEEEDPVKEKRNDLCSSIMNLNYESGFVSYDPLTGQVITNDGAKPLDAQDYTASGFDEAVRAITEYNESMVDAIRSGAIDSMTAAELDGYAEVIDGIYDVMYGDEVNLVTTLKNYGNKINEADNYENADDEVIAEYNATLSGYYDAIISALETLVTKYNSLENIKAADGVGAFALPDPLPEKFVFSVQ